MPQSLEYPNFYFMAKHRDLTGLKINRFYVKGLSHIKGYVHYWLSICDCGKECLIPTNNLISGKSKSCGCLRADTNTKNRKTHGNTVNGYSTEYISWVQMRARCRDKNRPDYERYGGRGVKVCERWLNSFENFLEDMGKKPSKIHTLDRFPNNTDGMYEPSNCRWATPTQQANNRRSSRFIEYNGIVKTLSEWTKELGLSSSVTLSNYIERNGVEKAMLHYAKK